MDQKLFVVCDANGVCQGIYTNEVRAGKIAHYIGAYVSDHIIDVVPDYADFNEEDITQLKIED